MYSCFKLDQKLTATNSKCIHVYTIKLKVCQNSSEFKLFSKLSKKTR